MASDAFKQKLLAQARAIHAAAKADLDKQAKKTKLQNYINQATADHGHQNMARRNTTGDTQKEFARKEANRQKGISRAYGRMDKLGEEASDVCPVCGQTPCNCTHINEVSLEKLEPGIHHERTTMIRRAINKAAKRPPEQAQVTYGVNYRKEDIDEARAVNSATTRASLAQRKTKKPLTPEEQIAKDKMKFEKWKAKQGKVNENTQLDEVDKSSSEYKSSVTSYGTRAANLLHRSWDLHGASKEKAKAGDKEGAAKLSASGSRAHKLFLKARDKHLENPVNAEASRKRIMSGISADYEDQEAKRGIGHVRDHVEVNPYLGLVDESSDKLYAGYQADVLSLKAKAAAQEKKYGPVDINKLAARLKAVKLPPEGKKK